MGAITNATADVEEAADDEGGVHDHNDKNKEAATSAPGSRQAQNVEKPRAPPRRRNVFYARPGLRPMRPPKRNHNNEAPRTE